MMFKKKPKPSDPLPEDRKYDGPAPPDTIPAEVVWRDLYYAAQLVALLHEAEAEADCMATRASKPNGGAPLMALCERMIGEHKRLKEELEDAIVSLSRAYEAARDAINVI